MDWFYPKRRGPEWKQGWTGQALASAAAPPVPLLAIFGIVMVLLWLSGYTDYKAQMPHNSINLQLFLILMPILLILFIVLFSTVGSKFSFGLPRRRVHRKEAVLGGGGASPWGVAVVVVVVLVLLSYQSSFHSKWFGAN